MERFEELLKSIGGASLGAHCEADAKAAEKVPTSSGAEVNVARAAEEAAAAASLHRMAAEISLESHGYQPIKRLGGSTTATVMVVNRLGVPEQQFVVKAMALRGMDEQERRRALQEVKILKV